MGLNVCLWRPFIERIIIYDVADPINFHRFYVPVRAVVSVDLFAVTWTAFFFLLHFYDRIEYDKKTENARWFIWHTIRFNVYLFSPRRSPYRTLMPPEPCATTSQMYAIERCERKRCPFRSFCRRVWTESMARFAWHSIAIEWLQSNCNRMVFNCHFQCRPAVGHQLLSFRSLLRRIDALHADFISFRLDLDFMNSSAQRRCAESDGSSWLCKYFFSLAQFQFRLNTELK